MVSIRKTGEGYYLASLTANLEVLSRNECHHLKQELSQIIKAHREVSVNMKGIENINKEGFKILEEIMFLAKQKRCKIRFINVNPQVSSSISKLTENKVKFQDELDMI